MVGVTTEVVGVTTEVVGVTTEVVGVTTEVVGVTTEVDGVTTEVVGVTTEVVGVTTEVDTEDNLEDRINIQSAQKRCLIRLQYIDILNKHHLKNQRLGC